MDKNLLDILKNNEATIKNDQLIGYLQGSLPKEDLHNVQQQEMEDAMMADAMEGLQNIRDKAKLESMTKEMNLQLQKKLKGQQQKHKETRKWEDQTWIMLSIVSVLMLIVICYIVFRLVK